MVSDTDFWSRAHVLSFWKFEGLETGIFGTEKQELIRDLIRISVDVLNNKFNFLNIQDFGRSQTFMFIIFPSCLKPEHMG